MGFKVGYLSSTKTRIHKVSRRLLQSSYVAKKREHSHWMFNVRLNVQIHRSSVSAKGGRARAWMSCLIQVDCKERWRSGKTIHLELTSLFQEVLAGTPPSELQGAADHRTTTGSASPWTRPVLPLWDFRTEGSCRSFSSNPVGLWAVCSQPEPPNLWHKCVNERGRRERREG